MAAKRDYYEVLGVERSMGSAEIRSAYRKLAAKYHPDVNPGDHEAEERFKEINEAHEVLSSPEKREFYDRYGHNGPQGGLGPDGFGVSDIFDMFFGAGGRPGGAEQARQEASTGSDLRYDLEITLEEAAFGVEKTLQLSRLDPCQVCSGSGSRPGSKPQPCVTCAGAGQVRQVQNTILGSFTTVLPCPRCKGEGTIVTDPCTECRGQGRTRQTSAHQVRVPAGVETGIRLVDQGEGDAGPRNGPRGDLFIVISVKAHAQFKRRGPEIFYDLPLSFAQATLGDTLQIPVLGGMESLTIPEGTQPGAQFRLRGRGVPDLNSRSQDRGDQIVVVNLTVPTRLNDEQRRLLKEFSATFGEQLQTDDRGIFAKIKDSLTNR